MGKKYTKEEEIGRIFGRLTVIDFFPNHYIDGKRYHSKAKVICNCGSEPFFVEYRILMNGDSQSCGCLWQERIIKSGGNTKHNMRNDPYWQQFYHTAVGAIGRCKPEHPNHFDYYDRGIKCFWSIEKVAEFCKYLEKELGPRPEGYSLDHIDNNKGYEPGNMRWASKKEQTENRRSKIKNWQYDKLLAERDALLTQLNSDPYEALDYFY